MLHQWKIFNFTYFMSERIFYFRAFILPIHPYSPLHCNIQSCSYFLNIILLLLILRVTFWAMAACIRSNKICFFLAHSEWLLMTIFALFIVPIYLPDDVSSVSWCEYMNVSVSLYASLYLFIFYLMISLSETHST